MHILYSSFCRCRVKKNNKNAEFYVEVKSAKVKSDQSDLNAPDVVITICQLISTNVPGGLEHSNSNNQNMNC